MVIPATGWLAIVAAPFVGSFAAVVVERWGKPDSALVGRSRCASCHTPLAARDLVPIFSWLLLRGRCRQCGGRIGLFPLVMELAALGIGVWAALIFPAPLVLPSALLGWMLLAAAEIDRRHMVLPDVLTLPLIPIGLAALWLAAPDALSDAVIGTVAGGVALWTVATLYRHFRGRDGLGMGDVKLFAAAGAWTGWQGLPSVLLWAGLSGLATALVLGRRRGTGLAAANAIPFGPFLALGFWLVWSFGPFEPI